MFRVPFFSRFVMPALMVGLLLGVGVGLTLARGSGSVEAGVGAEVESQVGDTPVSSERPAQTQFYERVAGSSFRPFNSMVVFNYGANGCLYQTGTTDDNKFTYDLQLPQGAEINFLRLFFNDTSLTDNIGLSLYAFDNAGFTVEVADVSSTGWNGWGSTTSSAFSHFVDNASWSYILWADIPDGPGSGLRICGVSVGYGYSVAANYLPAMLNLGAP